MDSKHNDNNLHTSGFNVCPSSGQIIGSQKTIRVSPVNLRVLLVLLENQGQVVSRSKLFDTVWKNQVVSDDTLTRCISDIRGQLREISIHSKLIETIPKRGYRWLHAVSSIPPQREQQGKSLLEEPIESVPKIKTITTNKHSKWKGIAVWSFAAIFVFLLISTSVLWSVNHLFGGHTVRVAFLPIQIENKQYYEIAAEFEENLKAKLLLTQNIRFLSSRAMDETRQNLYPYLSREFAARWIIEGQIRENKGIPRMTINLVDAKTAIVFDSISGDITAKSESIDALADSFVALLSQKTD